MSLLRHHWEDNALMKLMEKYSIGEFASIMIANQTKYETFQAQRTL